MLVDTVCSLTVSSVVCHKKPKFPVGVPPNLEIIRFALLRSPKEDGRRQVPSKH
uniref:Uncharacterized protein n=1 Tax=Octopus bimaculoides TaxID=37653 RepID=A0A0L8GC21_OCTBM